MHVEERIQAMTESVMRNSAIPKANRTELKRYIDFLRAKGLKDASIDVNLYALKYFLEALGNKNVKKAKKEDIVEAIRKIQTAKRSKTATPVNSKRGPTLSKNTIEHIKSTIKWFSSTYLATMKSILIV